MALADPIVLATFRGFERLRQVWCRWSSKWSRLSIHLNESISGIRVVKAFAQEAREEKVFTNRNEELRHIRVLGERAWLTFYAVISFVLSQANS